MDLIWKSNQGLSLTQGGEKVEDQTEEGDENGFRVCDKGKWMTYNYVMTSKTAIFSHRIGIHTKREHSRRNVGLTRSGWVG